MSFKLKKAVFVRVLYKKVNHFLNQLNHLLKNSAGSFLIGEINISTNISTGDDVRETELFRLPLNKLEFNTFLGQDSNGSTSFC